MTTPTTTAPPLARLGAAWQAARRRAGDRWEALLAGVAPRRLPLAAVGLGLTVLGTLSPWATFPGFPGKMTLAGFPGGARAYVLVLAAVAALAVVDAPGRRRAATLGAVGALLVTVWNVIAVAADGGGLVNVAWGAWVTVAGTALLGLALASLPVDRPAGGWRRLPGAVELLAISGSLAALLYAVVLGLAVDAPSQFVSLLGLLGFGAGVLNRIGLFGWLAELYERHRSVTVTAALVAAIVFPFTQQGNAYWLRVAASVGVFAAAAVGLNVVVGLAGLLDLGYIAFFGVGAYVGALLADAGLTTVHVHLPFALVLLIGGCISAVFGVLIGAPTLRLRGDYLAIVTLAFGEIFRIAANNLDGFAGPNVTRGPNGIAAVPHLAIGGFDFGDSHELLGFTLPGPANYYFLELLLVVFVILVFSRLNASRIGRAWVAIREDETAAAAMGVNTIRLKLLAFAIGAFLAGMAGTVNAHLGRQVSPDSYTFLESILLLAAVVLGGMGTVGGALLGSTVLLVLPEKLREFKERRLLIFGLALVVMMRVRPEGIIANRRRQRELHDTDAGGDAMSAPPGSPVASA